MNKKYLSNLDQREIHGLHAFQYKAIKFLFLSFQNYYLYDTKFRRLSDDNKTYEVQFNHTIFLLS